jgi:hypothetical protein
MGHGNIIHLVFKYDVKVVIPILMICFHWLNPIVKKCKANGPSEELNKDDINIFDVGASSEKSSHALIIVVVVQKIAPIFTTTCGDLLVWCYINEG